MQIIKVKSLVCGLNSIASAHPGEWYDLRAANDISLKMGEYRRIPLGIAVKLPVGFEAILAARSSTYERWGIIPVNAIGIIDNGYSGDNDEWQFPVLAMRDTTIFKNDRICQFRIIRSQPDCRVKYVDHLDEQNRGGFGSTGRS